MKITLEKKTVLISTGFGLGLILVVGLIITPMSLAIRTMRQDMFQLRLFLEERLERASRLKTSTKNIAEIRSKAASWGDRLVRRGDELKIITMLENLASKNNVKYKIVSSNLDKPTEPHLKLNVTATGPYRTILSYLVGLEKSDYFITTRSAIIQLAPETKIEISKNPMVILTLDLDMYATIQ